MSTEENFEDFLSSMNSNKVNPKRMGSHGGTSPNNLIIFDKKIVLQEINSEANRTRRDVLRDLLKEQEHRPLATITQEIIHKLEVLNETFGNFHEVISRVKSTLLLSSLAAPKTISIPPLLLTGPPGVGKTRFISELAAVLGTDFFSLDFASVSSSFVIGGGTSAWMDSKPGFVTNSIRKSRYANPVLMLDEIDKVSSDSRHNPLGPMYSLLEKHTAKHFVDEYLGVPFDVSNVIWIASANYVERIPEPIRSRMIEIKIAPPTYEQSRAIIASVYRELLSFNAWGKHFTKTLDGDVIDKLSNLPPRLVRIQLETALANAVERSPAKKRPIKVHPMDVAISSISTKPSGIGFMAHI